MRISPEMSGLTAAQKAELASFFSSRPSLGGDAVLVRCPVVLYVCRVSCTELGWRAAVALVAASRP